MGVVVRQKQKGKGQPWWVFINRDGKIRSKKVGDRRAAESLASELRRRLKAGELHLEPASNCKQVPTFGEYAQRHLDNYAKTACKFTTWTGYEAIIRNHLLPVWEKKRLDQITRADVKTLILQKQQEGFSAGTAANIRTLVSGIFTHAYEDEILSVNPALKLGRFIAKVDRRRSIKPLTREQAQAFLRAAQEHSPEHHPLLLLAFRTGMRMGEILGLAWSDLDSAVNTITVQRSYSYGRFSTPKSRKFRVVDMSDQLKRTLQNHEKALRERFGGKLPSWEVPAAIGGRTTVQLLFPSEVGGPLDSNNFRRRVFAWLLEKANLPHFRFHDIRHTFASLLLTQGESLHYVKEQMGHASIQTTVDIYGHLVPGSNRNAVNRLDDPVAEPANTGEGGSDHGTDDQTTTTDTKPA